MLGELDGYDTGVPAIQEISVSEFPQSTLQLDKLSLFQLLLRCSHCMLPLLAEAHIIDHAINTIVAEIRTYFLHEWMRLLCSERPFSSEKIQNCLGEDSMYRPLSNPKPTPFSGPFPRDI